MSCVRPCSVAEDGKVHPESDALLSPIDEKAQVRRRTLGGKAPRMWFEEETSSDDSTTSSLSLSRLQQGRAAGALDSSDEDDVILQEESKAHTTHGDYFFISDIVGVERRGKFNWFCIDYTHHRRVLPFAIEHYFDAIDLIGCEFLLKHYFPTLSIQVIVDCFSGRRHVLFCSRRDFSVLVVIFFCMS